MSHGHDINVHQENFIFPSKTKNLCYALMLIGAILTAVGIFTIPKDSNDTPHKTEATAHNTEASHDSHQPEMHGEASASHLSAEQSRQNINGVDTVSNNEVLHPVVVGHAKPWYTRVYANLLMNGYFLLLIGVCGLFFYALQFIANAGWATILIRIPQAMSTILPIGAILLLLVFFLDGENIYHWVHYEHQHIPKGSPDYDPILADKSWFLNTKLIVGFMVCIPVIWFLFGKKLRSLSQKEDAQGGLTFFKKSITYSAAFTLFFGFGLSIISWVVMMSVDAHWYSTMYSLYNFATGWVTTLSIITLFVLFLKRNGYLKAVTDEHIHDLGKFMFAFTIFWSYLWLSQFLLIWYANIPEESVHFYKRWEGGFKFSFFFNLVMNFLIPFLALMTRNSKRNPTNLTIVAIVIIIGHWNDLYLMIMPGVLDHHAGVGALEIGMALLFVGVFIYWVLTALSKRNLIAVNHPYINESAHHDVGV